MNNDDDDESKQNLILKFYDPKSATATSSKSTKLTIIGIITCISTLFLAIYFKDSILNIFIYLDTIESENQFLLNLIIFLLFIAVSLPILWGYSLCILIVSYIHDFFYGFLITIVYSSIGMSVSFFMCRYLFYNLNCTTRYANSISSNNVYFNVFVDCIEGKNGYKIVLLSRIVPLPFGLANLLYAMTKISFVRYIIASTIGLMPTQLLTCYIGSTLKSIADIISYSKSKTAMNAYYIFAIQLLISFVLMYYLVKMAKGEFDRRLNLALNKNISNDNESSSSTTMTTTALATVTQINSSLNTIVIDSNEMVN